MKEIIIDNQLRAHLYETNKSIGNIVIAHGMMEHMERYDEFAKLLNKQNYNVILFDQIGHGLSASKNLGHWDVGAFKKSIDNYSLVINFIKKMYKGNKTYLFAHSMGSFIAQEFIVEHGNEIDGLIMSGSNGPLLSVKLGAIVSKLFKYNNKPNPFLNDLMFKPYTTIFKPKRTNFDWLTSVETEVDKYIKDPYCGFVCTTGFFKEFITSISKLNKQEKLSKINKSLPILLISGSVDPVGEMGKGISKLSTLYLNNGLKSVNLLLYPKARHELLNEFCRNKVMDDVVNWLKNRGVSND
jgi:alpha-beta hydrolase superfamily lysophospholipase